MKKIAALFSFCFMVCFITAKPVMAEEITRETYINPLYADEITEDDLKSPKSGKTGISAVPIYCTSLGKVGEKLREGMKERQETITIGYQTTEKYSSSWYGKIRDAAFSHTGVADEGDYIHWQYAGYNASASGYTSDGTTYITYTYTVTYYTTAEQESQVSAAVNRLLTSLSLSGKTDYEKIKTIYDYMCENITYDYDNLDNSDYKLKYTAYAALINKTAVCQGYANLFYRLMEEEGIDCRIVTGLGSGSNHAWNIVALQRKYYDVDATWDATRAQNNIEYAYFLKCEENFEKHERDEDYTTSKFISQYAMADSDFANIECNSHQWNDGDITKSATCTVDGKKLYTCTVCGKLKTESISALGHTETIDKAVEATCTKSGLTEGSHCSVCGEVLKEQKVVEALGHIYADNVCSRCGVTQKLATPSLTSIANVSTGIQVKWNKVNGAVKYQVFRRQGKRAYTKLAVTTSTNYIDKTAKVGTLYRYTVRCITSTGTFVSGYNTAGKAMVRLKGTTIASVGNTGSKKMAVKWKKNASASGYQIQYSTNSKFTGGNKYAVITKNSTLSKTISNLTKNKIYYVRVRCYKTVSGVKYYSAWSAVKKLKIKK